MIVCIYNHDCLECFVYHLLLEISLFSDVANTYKLREQTNDFWFFSVEFIKCTCSTTRGSNTVSYALSTAASFMEDYSR